MGKSKARAASLDLLIILLERFPETRPDVQRALEAIDAGGAVDPRGVVHPVQRELMTRLLKTWGLKERQGVFFCKKPGRGHSMADLLAKVPVRGSSKPLVLPTATAAPVRLGPAPPPLAQVIDDSSDTEPMGPALPSAVVAIAVAPARPPPLPAASSIQRDAWMSQLPSEADVQRAMRQQAMTSQKSRGFAKSSSPAPPSAPLPLLPSSSSAPSVAPEDKKFKWDYESMMNDYTIDKERTKQLLEGSSSVSSRFAAPKRLV